jgi:hypothetical protein
VADEQVRIPGASRNLPTTEREAAINAFRDVMARWHEHERNGGCPHIRRRKVRSLG